MSYLCLLHVKKYRLMLIGLTWPLKIECDQQKGSISFNFYERSLGYGGKSSGLFLFKWMFQLSPNYDSLKKLVQNCLHSKLGSLCVDCRVVWTKECSNDIPTYNYSLLRLSWGSMCSRSCFLMTSMCSMISKCN